MEIEDIFRDNADLWKKNAPSEYILDHYKTSNHIQSWWCIILCQANRRKTETTQKWPEFLAVFLTPGKELLQNVRSTSSFEFCANMKYVEYSGKTENAGPLLQQWGLQLLCTQTSKSVIILLTAKLLCSSSSTLGFPGNIIMPRLTYRVSQHEV